MGKSGDKGAGGTIVCCSLCVFSAILHGLVKVLFDCLLLLCPCYVFLSFLFV